MQWSNSENQLLGKELLWNSASISEYRLPPFLLGRQLTFSPKFWKREWWGQEKWVPRGLKGVCYIFTSWLCQSKGELRWNKEKCLLYDFESSFSSWDNQILTFQIFKYHDVIKCPRMNQETFYWITWKVNSLVMKIGQFM